MDPFFQVSLTFDDGWKSAIEHAFPLLEKYRVPATFYVISEKVGPEHQEYMDVGDLRTLVAHGHEIGSHTRFHKHLPGLPDAEVWDEISRGAEDLRLLGFESRTFAYPYGDWNPYVVKQVREAGFFGARTIERGINDAKTNHLLLRVYAVRETHTTEDVRVWIRSAREKGGWLILCFHQIESAVTLREREWIYGSIPDVLGGILNYLTAEEIEVVTVEQGLERLVTAV